MRWTTGILLALMVVWAALLPGCADRAGAESAPETAISRLPQLPADGPYVPRRASGIEITTLDGVDTFDASAEPAVAPHATQPQWLTLDGDLAAGGMCYAVWQLPLGPGTTLQQVEVNIQQSGLNRYHLAWADYSTGRWHVLEAANPAGNQGTQTFIPTDESAMHSPGHFAYLAVLVLPGHRINVGALELTAETPWPIYDQFEPNDSLLESQERQLFLGPGEYRMSVHETFNAEMHEIGQGVDLADYFQVRLEAGETLTTTVRHDPFNHWQPELREPQDLDLLFYLPGVRDELNGFYEPASSLNIQFYCFEHSVYTASAGGDYQIGVIAARDIDFPYKDDAEYTLSLFVTPNGQTRTVSGTVTQNNVEVDKPFIVFLEPGNFNAISRIDEVPHGKFDILGVPDGTYTMRVHGSAGFGLEGYVFPESEEVVVAGSNVTKNIDIGDNP